jgi:hypothetical protein
MKTSQKSNASRLNNRNGTNKFNSKSLQDNAEENQSSKRLKTQQDGHQRQLVSSATHDHFSCEETRCLLQLLLKARANAPNGYAAKGTYETIAGLLHA